MRMLSAMAFVLAASTVATPALAAQDAAFLTDAIKGDNSEVVIGELAQRRGASPATRRYGAMLVRDHGAHGRKIAALDRRMGIVPTSDISDDGAHAKAMLQDLHGQALVAELKSGGRSARSGCSGRT